jgi:hypothetical protein
MRKLQFLSLILFTVFIKNVSAQIAWGWTRTGNNIEEARAIASVADTLGNSYVVGYYSNGPITFGSTTLQNQGGSDIFLNKYGPTGTLSWSKRVAGSGTEIPTAITIDKNNNLYVSANITNTSFTFGTSSITSSAMWRTETVILKFNSSGIAQWAAQFTGNGPVQSSDIKIDKNLNLFVACYSTATSVTFGTITKSSNTTSGDGFIVKMNNSGIVSWVKQFTGGGIEEINALTVDDKGGAYFLGDFSSTTLIIDSATFTNQGVFGSSEVFYGHLNSLANVVMIGKIGGTNSQESFTLTHKNDKIYLSGSSLADFTIGTDF